MSRNFVVLTVCELHIEQESNPLQKEKYMCVSKLHLNHCFSIHCSKWDIFNPWNNLFTSFWMFVLCFSKSLAYKSIRNMSTHIKVSSNSYCTMPVRKIENACIARWNYLFMFMTFGLKSAYSMYCTAPLTSSLCGCPPHQWWPATSLEGTS